MPYLVSTAFNQFCSGKVDLESTQVKSARESRGFLEEQITAISRKHSDFPLLTGEYKPFGSFARSTKIRPLDDIDLLILYGDDVEPVPRTSCLYWLRPKSQTSILRYYTDDFGYVNSIRILNRLKSALGDVIFYKKSELNRRQEAVVLNLITYDWKFDLVPAFPVKNVLGDVQYYLIPDGKGEWKPTDPRVDQANVTSMNRQHNGSLLPLIRILKYWNTYNNRKPRLSSYYFETMVINGMKNKLPVSSVRRSIPTAFTELQMQLSFPCPDPKRLGTNLDDGVELPCKQKVKDLAREMAEISRAAIYHEDKEEHQQAIEKWQLIFAGFPSYG